MFSCREYKGLPLPLCFLIFFGESPAGVTTSSHQPPLPQSLSWACSCCWEMGPLGLEGERCNLLKQTFSFNRSLWSNILCTRDVLGAGAMGLTRSLIFLSVWRGRWAVTENRSPVSCWDKGKLRVFWEHRGEASSRGAISIRT